MWLEVSILFWGMKRAIMTTVSISVFCNATTPLAYRLSRNVHAVQALQMKSYTLMLLSHSLAPSLSPTLSLAGTLHLMTAGVGLGTSTVPTAGTRFGSHEEFLGWLSRFMTQECCLVFIWRAATKHVRVCAIVCAIVCVCVCVGVCKRKRFGWS